MKENKLSEIELKRRINQLAERVEKLEKTNSVNLGDKQRAIIKRGKEKGYVTPIDIRDFYSRVDKARATMLKLERLGYFKKEQNQIRAIWKFIGKKDNKTNKKKYYYGR